MHRSDITEETTDHERETDALEKWARITGVQYCQHKPTSPLSTGVSSQAERRQLQIRSPKGPSLHKTLLRERYLWAKITGRKRVRDAAHESAAKQARLSEEHTSPGLVCTEVLHEEYAYSTPATAGAPENNHKNGPVLTSLLTSETLQQSPTTAAPMAPRSPGIFSVRRTMEASQSGARVTDSKEHSFTVKA